MCDDCMPQFHVCVCETKIAICNWWEVEEFLNDMQARIQSFLEAFSLFLVFSVQTKPKNTVAFDCKLLRTKKHFNAENTPFLFKLV